MPSSSRMLYFESANWKVSLNETWVGKPVGANLINSTKGSLCERRPGTSADWLRAHRPYSLPFHEKPRNFFSNQGNQALTTSGGETTTDAGRGDIGPKWLRIYKVGLGGIFSLSLSLPSSVSVSLSLPLSIPPYLLCYLRPFSLPSYLSTSIHDFYLTEPEG